MLYLGSTRYSPRLLAIIATYVAVIGTAQSIPLQENEEWSDGMSPLRRTASLRGLWIRASNASTSTACIGDDSGFRKAVASASSDPKQPPTVITLCNRVKISKTTNPTKGNITGIDMSKKLIELKCFNPTGKRCILDGQRTSRIIFGSSTFLRATNFDFINAYTSQDDVMMHGSAVAFDSKSTISFNQCSFRSNQNDRWGGTVYAENSTLTLRGNATSPMVFSNNNALVAAAIFVNGTVFRAVTGNVFFNNNTASRIGALYVLDTDTAMNGVTFTGNSAEDNGAARVDGGTVSLEDVQFVGNRAWDYYSAISVSDVPKATFKRVTFRNNWVWHRGALTTYESSVSLVNCTFNNNTELEGEGADIYIEGTTDLVSCDNTVFCNGVGRRRIFDPAPKNTNCVEKGITKVCRA